MKLSAAMIAGLTAGPLAYSTVAAVNNGDIYTVLERGGLAAVLTFVLVRHLPQREESHKQERQDLIARLDLQRSEYTEQLQYQAAQHTRAVVEMTQQHKEATQSGHQAALALSHKLESVEGQVRRVGDIVGATTNARDRPENDTT